MPKRKRSGPPTLHDKLEEHQDEIFRALKAAKGFERQRLSKRVRDDGVTPEKKERLEREITVLKSLDLHQTARAHMYSSLIKIKSIAASTDLPDEIRAGVPKPELSAEEQAALHNVTSGLYNRDQVKKAVDLAVAGVCEFLKVPVPKKGKRLRKGKKEAIEEVVEEEKTLEKSEKVEEQVEAEDEDEEEWEEFHGFESDNDEPGPSLADQDSEAEALEEKAFSKYDDLLGSSSDEDSDDDDQRFERLKGREKANLDDISLSGSADSDAETTTKQPSRSVSLSPSPPPAKKKKTTTTKPMAKPSGSTFLPTLMGGYISGSESASSIDVAPAKKRLGQKQRQAIWEKKFGGKAKHLQRSAGRRDAGWDMKRGAVDGEDAAQRGPWKKGIRNPLVKSSHGPAREVKPERKKDDEGPLHPSWEARKKAKESQKTAAFSGAKIVFD